MSDIKTIATDIKLTLQLYSNTIHTLVYPEENKGRVQPINAEALLNNLFTICTTQEANNQDLKWLLCRMRVTIQGRVLDALQLQLDTLPSRDDLREVGEEVSKLQESYSSDGVELLYSRCDGAASPSVLVYTDVAKMWKKIHCVIKEISIELKGDVIMGDKYVGGDKNTASRGGVVLARKARADDITATNTQTIASENLPELATELKLLRAELKKRDVNSDNDNDEDIGKVAAAEKAASKGEAGVAIKALKSTTKWVADVAKSIGVKLAVAAIKDQMGE